MVYGNPAVMNPPESLRPLVEEGLIEEVIRPLRSGKEAQVFLVRSGGEERVAKVYKESDQRTFKHRSQYTEGRSSRNTRDQRAMKRQSKYGKAQDEAAWRSTEADIIYRLRAAEVRVPEPFAFSDGVLIMALVRDEEGRPAQRLADMHPSPSEAVEIFDKLLAETVKMLCCGVVHGDLSEFNVLMGAGGPVIIDFPQALDPAKNRNASRILIRDVANLERFVARHQRGRRPTRYGQEMWQHFENQTLVPDMRLTGRAQPSRSPRHQENDLLAEIQEMERNARERRAALGLPPPRPARAPIIRDADASPPTQAARPSASPPRKRSRRRRSGSAAQAPAIAAAPQGHADSAQAASQTSEGQGKSNAPLPSRRRRRGRRRGTKSTPSSNES